MPSPQGIAYLVVLISIALAGLTSNGFITAVITIEWTKCRSLASSEQLLLTLGIFNFCSTISITAFYFHDTSMISDRFIHSVAAIYAVSFFAAFVTSCRFWLTAWLCVFYCVKIVNSTHSFFRWWKLRISWLLPRLLVVSVFFSLITSFFAYEKTVLPSQNTTTSNVTDVDQTKFLIETRVSYIIFFFVAGSSCPLLVVFLCSILIVGSLYRHVCQITAGKSSFKNPQTEAHIKAATTILLLLFIYLCVYMAQILIMMKYENQTIRFLSILVILMYSPAQAAILFLVNPKLKKAATRILPGF